MDDRKKLPVLGRAEAVRSILEMHAQLDGAIARRDAQIGARIACHKGCNACCGSPVLVSEGEALAIAEWLREPAHAETRARFGAAYPTWRSKVGDLLERTNPSDPQWMMSVHRAQAMCAFNHEGACSIYPVRPALCRKTHALDTNENCTSETVPAKCYQHPETEQLFEDQRPMRFAIHKSLRPGSHLDLVCSAVNRLLGAAVGRNDPCTCGSGKKFKKCCGA
jgi:Fe-S-cluster containining protein